MQRAMHATVDEVGRVLAGEGDDAGFGKGGTVSLARTAAQQRRLAADVDEARAFGFGADDLRWLDADEVERPLPARRARAPPLFTPHCAAVHPLRLVHAVAAAAQRRGVRIHERTPVAGDRAAPGHDRRAGACAPTSSSWRPRRSPSTSPGATAT